MRIIYLILILCVTGQQLSAQSPAFTYNDYFYYRNHLYLNTSSVLLNAAGLKAASKDTAASIEFIKQAVAAGMFDSGYITFNSRVNFVTKRKEWKDITAGITKTAKSYADPENMQLSFEDINRFWKLYDKLDEPGAAALVMNEYIMKGSLGLRTFFEKRMGLQPNNLINHIRKKKKYFASIRNVSLSLYKYKPEIISAAKKLKKLFIPKRISHPPISQLDPLMLSALPTGEPVN